MHGINHYKANSEFRLLYHEMKWHYLELEAFLKHTQDFISKTENQLNENSKIYSSDFFEYYHAGTYGYTFRNSFVITISSISETYVKAYINIWANLMKIEISKSKLSNGLLDYLKYADKKILEIGVDFSKREVEDFRGLLAIRNSIVHSDSNLQYVEKYTPQIKRMTKRYSSIQLSEEGSLWTNEQFCYNCLEIAERFFSYLFRLTIRKFPKYRDDRNTEDGFTLALYTNES